MLGDCLPNKSMLTRLGSLQCPRSRAAADLRRTLIRCRVLSCVSIAVASHALCSTALTQQPPNMLKPLWVYDIDDGAVIAPPIALIDQSSVAVAENFTSLVLLDRATGIRKAAVTRKGAGPGEFRGIEDLAACGSAYLCVADPVNARISVLRANLDFVASMRTTGIVQRLFTTGPREIATAVSSENAPTAIAVHLWSVSPDPAVLEPSSRFTIQTPAHPNAQPRFFLAYAVSADRVAHALVYRYEIHVKSRNGTTLRTIARTDVPERKFLAGPEDRDKAKKTIAARSRALGIPMSEVALEASVAALTAAPAALIEPFGMAFAPDGRLAVLRPVGESSQIDMYSSAGDLVAEWQLPFRATRLAFGSSVFAVSGADALEKTGFVALFAVPSSTGR